MFSLLLAIIYLAFISLGLPDSVVGATWPIMVVDLNAEISYMGIISIIISVGTIISSVFSDGLIRKFGTGAVTAFSVTLTAVALLGYGLSHSFWVLCLFSIPYGIGAGAVDSALNNYVALHYSSRHMSWLHACWGVGASIGPYVMSFALAVNNNWRFGFGYLFLIQIVLAIFMFCSLTLWQGKQSEENTQQVAIVSKSKVLKIKGVKLALLAFFCYCAFETTAGLWASTFLVKQYNTPKATATLFASFFYLGITLGRFACGFISDKLGDKKMIRLGGVAIALGLILMFIPLKTSVLALIGLIVVGIGGAPVYPCLMHSTPINFGKENSQTIMGMQTASAYVGSTFIPPIFGIIAQYFSAQFFPYFMGVFVFILILTTELINKGYNSKLIKE